MQGGHNLIFHPHFLTIMAVRMVIAVLAGSLLVGSHALRVPSPKMDRLPAMRATNVASQAKMATSSVAALLPLPALAEGDGGFDILGVVLTGGIGLLLLFIGSFAFQAAQEVGSQAGERCVDSTAPNLREDTVFLLHFLIHCLSSVRPVSAALTASD